MALSGIFPVTIAQAQFEQTYTAINGDDKSFPGWKLGDVCIDNLGGQWIFVKAGELLTQYSLCVVLNSSLEDGTYVANMVEAADIATGPKILGVNQVAIASGSYGWLHRGPGGRYGSGLKIRAENATKGALLHPLSGTAGAVDDANVDEGVIAGLQTLVTTTTLTAVEYIATTILTCNLTEVD